MAQTASPTRRGFLRALAAGAGAAVLADFSRLDAATGAGVRRLNRDRRDPSEALREAYLLDPSIRYLNHASIGTVPRVVHDAHREYTALCETNPWLYMWGGAWEEARESVRARAGDLLAVNPEDVAITHNTTEAFNLLARGLPLGPGDEVLFTNLNHPGASIAWERFGPERGYSVRRATIPLGRSAQLTGSDLVDAHDRAIGPRTRVLVVPHLDNIVGLRHPLAELVEAARARGVEYVAVDGAQTAGMLPLDVEATGVDFYATSGHKWIQSPKGLGLLYVRRELRDSLTPLWVTWGQARWSGTARVFEDYGTRNLPELLAMGDALDVQASLGDRWKLDRYRALREHLRQAVGDAPELTWRSPTDPALGGPLVAVERRGADAGRLGRWLWEEHQTVVRAFPGEPLNTIRVSPNVTTSNSELDRFVELLRSYAP
jgi:selenocysteine lyase/cysteine desulfurase